MWNEGVGLSEWIVIIVVALLVVGPKDLPIVMRKLGEWTRKLRDMAGDFRHSFDELARQTELDKLREEIDALKGMNPINDIKREIDTAVSMGDNYLKPQIPAPEYQFVKDEAPEIVEETAKPKKPRKPRAKKVAAVSDQVANND